MKIAPGSGWVAFTFGKKIMTTICHFRVPEDAYLFRSYLINRGIDAHILDEHVVQIAWHYSNAIGGVRVVVHDHDALEADKVTHEYLRELRAEAQPTAAPRFWPVVMLVSLWLGVPALIFGRNKVE